MPRNTAALWCILLLTLSASQSPSRAQVSHRPFFEKSPAAPAVHPLSNLRCASCTCTQRSSRRDLHLQEQDTAANGGSGDGSASDQDATAAGSKRSPLEKVLSQCLSNEELVCTVSL